MAKPIFCCDFDGVIHSYTSGWKGADVVPDPPVDGAFDFLIAMMEEFRVQIFSSRSNQEGGIHGMQEWMRAYATPEQWESLQHITFPTEKPPALVGLDDRVVTFTGTWPSVADMRAFKPWNKQ